MEGFLVISWWDDFKKAHVVPVVTTHNDKKIAEEELKNRKKNLGKNSKVILAKVIKEF
ncbi:MAG: hypothetical protein AAB404_02295 [Patescibacteria group bacterium]